ncbi:Oidioi.mRNA.OKI2018_I69.PAR.g11001.t1.cds [Oikopleura dioica]|uniref:Oidioi.mRNA.OKI2018_I69.PAR.g11001.t1.cds n=1 Tax=Oikopleura dioica TaxID=34765 RepID=A0ABN7RTS6_OIKDI|nr:Oidioi.mRNA.OKI2018_I69.PAR.g11001.t1.cds [Oikopleura dioica]
MGSNSSAPYKSEYHLPPFNGGQCIKINGRIHQEVRLAGIEYFNLDPKCEVFCMDCDRRMTNYDIRVFDRRVFLVLPPEAPPEPTIPVVPAPVAFDLFSKVTTRAHRSSRLGRI